jgi:tetratricopeptide (TPR) repeat protein
MISNEHGSALSFLLAGNLALKADQCNEALEKYTSGLQLAPESAGLHLNRSIAHERLGDVRAAFYDLDRFLTLAGTEDLNQNQYALKRFIGFGINQDLKREVLWRMQELEKVSVWQTEEFYNVLIGLLVQVPQSFELNLLHYLTRACEAACLSRPCLETALNLWELQWLVQQDSGILVQEMSAQDMLVQMVMLPSAPDFVLYVWLNYVLKNSATEDAHKRSTELLSLWVQLHPLDAFATEHLIQVLLQNNQLDMAEGLFLDLSRRFPREPNYLLGLARARLFKRDLERAFIVINAALDLDENNLAVRLERARIFEQLLSPHLALVDLNQNLLLDPNHLPTLMAKVNALGDLGRFEDALALIAQLGSFQLSDEDRLSLDLAQSFIYRLSGALEQWFAHVEYLSTRYPENEPILCELGWKEIHQGNWQKGFALLEHRFVPGMHYFPLQPHLEHARIPKWSPESFNASVVGMRLLLCAEEGMGDIVQFSRFIPRLLSRGLRITLVCKQALHPLFAFNFPAIELMGPDALIQELSQSTQYEYDFYGEMMSIPWVLQLSVTDLSGAPYLQALPEKVAEMAQFKAACKNKSGNQVSIGLRWLSSLARSGRSVPLEELTPLNELPIDLFGLHFGPLANKDKSLYEQWPNFIPTELNIEEVTGLMMSLDCIVTSDTVTAHLAGALGRPTILMKSSFIDWRWGSASIWYDSMQILRQETFNQWGLSVASLVKDLHCRMNSTGPSLRDT